MDVKKLDASWEKAVALRDRVVGWWGKAKALYHKVLVALAFPLMIGCALLIVYLLVELIISPKTRHDVGLGVQRTVKWYIIWGVVGWVVSKVWKKFGKKPEDSVDANDEEPSVQGSKPKNRRKNNRRVQRGR